MPPEVVVPDAAGTKPVFHESIDERTSAAGIERLRTRKVGENDIEVRIWAGFGKAGYEGVMLDRVDGKWSAFHLLRDNGNKAVTLPEPTRGWDALWQSLTQHRILSLPNAADINCRANYFDGHSYVVEVKKGPNYRTYMYDNPAEKFKNRCKEADEILAIARTVSESFVIPGF